jgi:S1-C subfamily serine protease
MDAVAGLVKHVLPTVVHIHAEVSSDHPSVRILGDDRMGSGTVVDPSGLILTVNYVVMGARTIHVSFPKGRSARAELVAQDFEVGLALLRIKRQGLPAVTFGASDDIERGQPVFAVSAMSAQERRASGGLVTYVGEFEAYWEYLLDHSLVSSAANPGYGGGGLFTLQAQLVGIVYVNLNEITRSSLSIPLDCYRANAEEFLRYGRVVSRRRRAFLGLFAEAVEEGVVVVGLVPEGPGDRAGLREGDVILSVNAEEVPTRRDFYLSLWRHSPGERLTMEVMRDNETRRLEVTGGDRAEFFKQT